MLSMRVSPEVFRINGSYSTIYLRINALLDCHSTIIIYYRISLYVDDYMNKKRQILATIP